MRGSTSVEGRPRAVITGRGFVSVSSGEPSTKVWKQAVLNAARPVLMPLTSVAAVQATDQVVALTYDDGPNASWTPHILDALAERNAAATFFMLVERAEAQPDLVRRVIAEGHDVGLHGVDHTRLTSLPTAQARHSVRDGQRRLEGMVGRPVRWFRPPYGAQNVSVYAAARRAGMEVVAWNVWGRDWEPRSASEVADTVRRGLSGGSIVLLHDSYEPAEDSTTEAPSFHPGEVSRTILSALDVDGYTVVPLERLVAQHPAVRLLWFGR